MIPWIKDGEMDDIVFSSRVRLARNFQDEKFPVMMDEPAQERVYLRMVKALSPMVDFTFLRMKDLSEIEKLALVEKYIASPELIQNPRAGLATSADETIDVMIGEEDHLRIQALISGFALENGLSAVLDFEQGLQERFAFDAGLGYLTACPTNTGTGMRASMMLHLPSVIMSGQLHNVVNAVSKMGMTVRGVYGEGSESTGNMVQLSNQVTLGLNEKEIVENLKAVAQKIIDNERNARSVLLEIQRGQLEDKIFRSFGVLRYARAMTTQEMVQLLSDVKLGVALGLIQGIRHSELHQILILARPHVLQVITGRPLPEQERDVLRAELVRQRLEHATEAGKK